MGFRNVIEHEYEILIVNANKKKLLFTFLVTYEYLG